MVPLFMESGCSIPQQCHAVLGTLLLGLGQALGQAEGLPELEPKPVLEAQLTESENGLLLDGGKPYTGEVVNFHPNKKKSESYSLKEGRLHGPFVTYREDGSRAFQVTFADGIEHGPFKRWFEDGTIWVVEQFRTGKLNGVSLTYFSNGQLQVQSIYRAGKKEGLEIGWYETGQQRWEAVYENGKLKNKLSWKRDGKPFGNKAPTIL